MKVIQHGNPKKNRPDVTFTCENCGCVFIAEYGEYTRHDSQIQGDWYETHCPECKAQTTKDVTYIEQTWR